MVRLQFEISNGICVIPSLSNSWPSHKLKAFWNSASQFMNRGGASNTCRSGSLCGYKSSIFIIIILLHLQPVLRNLFSRLPVDTHVQVLSKLFTPYLSATSLVLVPVDFCIMQLLLLSSYIKVDVPTYFRILQRE